MKIRRDNELLKTALKMNNGISLSNFQEKIREKIAKRKLRQSIKRELGGRKDIKT
jgi:hypothetical protein